MNALIAGYSQNGHCEEAFEAFHQIQRGGFNPNQITYMNILNACAGLESLERGMEVHAHITKAGLQSDVRWEMPLSPCIQSVGASGASGMHG